MKLLFIFLVFLATDCGTSDDIDNQEIEKAKLESLNKEIKAIAIASQCSDEYTCFSIGFGSKPCGGHWEYLVYSNSIDVVDFLAKINAYNELEEMFNKKYNIMSDCMLVMAPSKTICENGKCKAVYDN
jgi:hypothetical protein